MKTLLATILASVAFAGVAAAKDAPQLVGNYSDNVLQAHGNAQADQARSDVITFSSSAAITSRSAAQETVQPATPAASDFDRFSGR